MGMLKYVTSAKYEVMWIRDKANYRRVMIYANKDKYDGKWLAI